MATQTIKLLNLPDGGSYNFNAVQLDGHSADYFATAAKVATIEALAAKDPANKILERLTINEVAYYDSIVTCIDDLNNGQPAVNSNDKSDRSECFIYLKNGTLVIVLLKDIFPLERLYIKVPVEFVFAGHRIIVASSNVTAGLTCNGSYTYINGTMGGGVYVENPKTSSWCICAGPSVTKFIVDGGEYTIKGKDQNTGSAKAIETYNSDCITQIRNARIDISGVGNIVLGCNFVDKATVKDSDIKIHTTSSTSVRGILAQNDINIENCNISTVATVGTSSGVSVEKGRATVVACNIEADSSNNVMDDTSTYGCALKVSPEAESCSISYGTYTGTHSAVGMMSNDFRAFGATFYSCAHGGIYFSGQKAYVKDCIIGCRAYNGRFDFSSMENDLLGDFYIGSNSDCTVYMDNCVLTGEGNHCGVLRGSGGEKRNILYISRTAIPDGKQFRIDSGNYMVAGEGSDVDEAQVTLPSALSTTAYIYDYEHMCATDTKVTQTPTSSNDSYPLLLAPSNQTTATTTTSYFDSGVTLNPSTNTITSNITGSAKSLLSTDFYSAEGSSGYIKFATLSYNSWRQFNAVFLLQNQYNSEYSSSLVKICGSYGNTSIAKFDFEIIGGDDVSDKLFYYKDGESYTFYVKKNNYSHWYLTRLSNVGNAIVFDGYSTLLTTATTTGTAKYNVSASKLATERTIAISGAATGTATSFDGTKNISIPVASIKEAYLTWGGKNFAGGWGPIDAAMVPNFAANRFAFLPASAITLEYSTDGGSTWTAKNDDAAKKNLFSTSGSFYIGNNSSTGIDKKNYKCRVTITTSGVVYSRLNKFAIRVSTGGSTGCHVKLESRTKANQDAGNNTWVTDVSRAELSGWSGWNIINVPGITTHGNNSAHYSQLRFTFGVDSHASTLTNPGLQILCIMAFGGEGWTTCSNMARDGHLYSYDADQNATFPAALNTTGNLTENGTRVSKVGHTHTVSGVPTSASFSGTTATLTTSTSSNTTVATSSHTHTTTSTGSYTPAGTNSAPTFTGSAATSGGASATQTIYQITSVGSAPSLSASIANNCMTFTWSAGSVPSRSSVDVALASHTHSVTAKGSVSAPTFTGTAATISVSGTSGGPSATVNVAAASHTHTVTHTPAGNVSLTTGNKTTSASTT